MGRPTYGLVKRGHGGFITEADKARGQWLGWLRDAAGMTPEELCARADVSAGWINDTERWGHVMYTSTPRQLDRIGRVAGALGVDLSGLLLEFERWRPTS